MKHSIRWCYIYNALCNRLSKREKCYYLHFEFLSHCAIAFEIACPFIISFPVFSLSLSFSLSLFLSLSLSHRHCRCSSCCISIPLRLHLESSCLPRSCDPWPYSARVDSTCLTATLSLSLSLSLPDEFINCVRHLTAKSSCCVRTMDLCCAVVRPSNASNGQTPFGRRSSWCWWMRPTRCLSEWSHRCTLSIYWYTNTNTRLERDSVQSVVSWMDTAPATELT